MTRRNIFVGLLLIALALGSAACKSVADKVSDVTGGGKTVTVSIVYGSEKQEWLEPLIQQYNDAKRKTPDGATIVVQGTPLGSVEAADVDGRMLTGRSQASRRGDGGRAVSVANARACGTHRLHSAGRMPTIPGPHSPPISPMLTPHLPTSVARRWFLQEYAKRNVTANCIAPGFIVAPKPSSLCRRQIQ